MALIVVNDDGDTVAVVYIQASADLIEIEVQQRDGDLPDPTLRLAVVPS